jgi:hypothetical protein
MRSAADLQLQGEARAPLGKAMIASAEQHKQLNPAKLQEGMNYGVVWNEAMVQRGERQQV